MPVPNSPQPYRRVVPVDLVSRREEEEQHGAGSRLPARKYSSTASEAFSSSSGEGGRKPSVTGSSGLGGWHRSRERTRQSAVQRLVERKLAQKEKEREKERDRSWAGSQVLNNGAATGFPNRSYSRERGCRGGRDLSGTRSENGFMLGGGSRASSPSKENIWSGSYSSSRPPRASRSCSGSRYRDFEGTEEATAKTYITIGPGKPTRIREHSPSKSAKLSSEETVTSARERSAQSRHTSPLKAFDLNRPSSPSPHRKLSTSKAEARNVSDGKNREYLRTASPLKSTDILKSFQSSNKESAFSQRSRKISFLSEKSIQINQTNPTSPVREKRERKLSIEILKTPFKISSGDISEHLKRASVESEQCSSNRSSLSSLSGSSDSGVEADRPPPNISQRRISLEQRFQARARISSPERSENYHQVSSEKSSHGHGNVIITNEFVCRRVTSESRKRSSESVAPRAKPIPASRKISLPQPPHRRPQPAPRRRSSLHTIVATDR